MVAGVRKEKLKDLVNAENEVLRLEEELGEEVMQEKIHTLHLKRDDYKAIATDRAKALGREKDGRVYDLGDKAGKLIAWLDRKEMASRLVPELIDEAGEKITDPQEIANEFAAPYSVVFQASTTFTKDDSQDLLRDIKLPTLSAEEMSTLDSDFTNDEIAQAIRSLQSGKALGPNGLPIELYKLRLDKLAPHLRAMFEESKRLGTLPPDQRVATLVTIHKECKPKRDCSSY